MRKRTPDPGQELGPKAAQMAQPHVFMKHWAIEDDGEIIMLSHHDGGDHDSGDHDRGEPLLVVTFGTDTNVDLARRLLHRLAHSLREIEDDVPF